MIFTVHMKREDMKAEAGEQAIADALEVVPEAMAKWALVLPPLWLAWHRLWWPLVFYIAVAILLLALLTTPVAVSALFLSGLPGLYLLLEGNQLRRQKLEEIGYQTLGVVDAPNAITAVEKFLSEADLAFLDGKPEPQFTVSPIRNSQPSPSFGLFSDSGH